MISMVWPNKDFGLTVSPTASGFFVIIISFVIALRHTMPRNKKPAEQNSWRVLPNWKGAIITLSDDDLSSFLAMWGELGLCDYRQNPARLRDAGRQSAPFVRAFGASSGASYCGILSLLNSCQTPSVDARAARRPNIPSAKLLPCGNGCWCCSGISRAARRRDRSPSARRHR